MGYSFVPMAHPKNPLPALFFASFILQERRNQRIEALAHHLLDPPWMILGPYAFKAIHYHREMGEPLQRWIYFESHLRSPEQLVKVKHQAYQIEQREAQGGRRTINIDPGYLNYHQVVIATFKDHAHRIYLGKGVFAHLEYLFHQGKADPLPWTYPDFRTQKLRKALEEGRKLYDELIKASKAPIENG